MVGEYIYLYRYLPIIEVWRSLHSRTLQYQMASSNQLGHQPSSILQLYPIIPGVFSTPTSGSLGCLLARQLCLEDSACNQVLQVIPRVCGLELGKFCKNTFCPFNKIFSFFCIKHWMLIPNGFIFSFMSLSGHYDILHH